MKNLDFDFKVHKNDCHHHYVLKKCSVEQIVIGKHFATDCENNDFFTIKTRTVVLLNQARKRTNYNCLRKSFVVVHLAGGFARCF